MNLYVCSFLRSRKQYFLKISLQRRKRGIRRFINLHKITELVTGRARIQTEKCGL